MAAITGEPLNLIEALAQRIAESIFALESATRTNVSLVEVGPQTAGTNQRAVLRCVGDHRAGQMTALQAGDDLVPATVDVALSLGANLGDRLAALQRAIDVVTQDPAVEAVAVSAVCSRDRSGWWSRAA